MEGAWSRICRSKWADVSSGLGTAADAVNYLVRPGQKGRKPFLNRQPMPKVVTRRYLQSPDHQKRLWLVAAAKLRDAI